MFSEFFEVEVKEVEKISVDKDTYDFLFYSYFKDDTDPYIACSDRAYLDLCRTLSLKSKNGSEFRHCVNKILKASIIKLLSDKEHDQLKYDVWHRKTCNSISKPYANNNIVFNVGHAQKWINMAMKYLYMQRNISIECIFSYLHIPLDIIILNRAAKEFKLKSPFCCKWSKINNYDEYLDYQKKLRDLISIDPIRWEFQSWIAEVNKKYKKNKPT